MRKLRRFPFHPFLFSAYAVLGVYATNANEIPVAQNIRPLFVIIFITGLILFIANKRSKDLDRAGFISTLIIFWIFYFGHLFFFVSFLPLLKDLSGKQLLLALAWAGILIGLGNPIIWKSIKNPTMLTGVFNLVATVLITLPLISTLYIAVETNPQQKLISKELALQMTPKFTTQNGKPDIYYVILDGYGRNDVLNDIYGYDNNQFTDSLSELGFYVAPQATSNYPQTALSLSSLLNIRYLDFLTNVMGRSQNRDSLNELIKNSLIRNLFSKEGYAFYALSSSVSLTQLSDADKYFSFSSSPLNDLESLIFVKTVPGAFTDALGLDIPLQNYSTQRKSIAYALETLNTLPTQPGPKFVFAHILAPHPPFVFDSAGNAIQPNRPYFIGDATGFPGPKQEYISGYTDEISYLNSQIITVINTILEESADEPIIIIHGDHGPGAFTNFNVLEQTCLRERFAILLAVHFPSHNYSAIEPDISLVNLFPAILNSYFSSGLPYRENKQYYSTWGQPYQFMDVSDKINTCSVER